MVLQDNPLVKKLIGAGWPPRLLGILAFIGFWILVAERFPNDLMPYPLETVMIAFDLLANGRALSHVYWTFIRTVFGFIGAIILGVGIGILMGVNDQGRSIFTPVVLLGLTIPALVWGVVWTLILGFVNEAVIASAIVVVFPFIAIPIWKAVEGIDQDLVEMADSFQIPRLRLIRRLLIPSIFPALASVSRYAVAICFHIVTIGEMLATNNGIGEMIIYTYATYRYEEAWAWALLFMTLILVVEYGILKPLENRAFIYRDDIDFKIMG